MVWLYDHVAVDVSQENLLERRKCINVKRQWKRLSKCQKSCLYTVITIAILTVFYYKSFDSGGAVITVDVDKGGDDPDNVGNQVLEEPNDVNGNNNGNSNQVVEPPNNVIAFPGPSTAKQKAVIKAFRHAWKGYRQFAWGHDHLKPISEGYNDWFGLGLSIVDSLDTMYIMGLKEEYAEARDWVDKHLTFDVNRDVNLFEVTIRILGGLLSVYHFTKDDLYLKKATDLGDRLMPCFESDSGVPYSDVNLFTHKAHAPKWSPDSSTSEVTTIQLEFRYLSWVTGDPKYETAVLKVSRLIHALEKKDGLVPIFINANTGQFRSYATVTLGARGDSYYEYLLKQWIQTEKSLDYLVNDYVEAVDGIRKHLVRKTVPNGFVFVGELLGGGKDFKPKMDHLTCYLPGTLALGAHNGLSRAHADLADDLMTTCYQTYAQQPTFLAPEITYFNIQGETSNDMYVKANDAHNLLRPEFIESLWVMYQLTGNATYQDWGWQIFQGFENYTRVLNGYTSIGNVRNPANVRPKDMMESFFLSETLKYLYLLFSDDPKLLDLDKFVLNTEAHPLPIGRNRA
ncbi:endoplasmic reticulum mannosyl-oligosaccharide 1,2-alpha-mannosidase [Cylas formicarius]|uniref:endoplasmic reticulum mannosyl-oligosaccharide 1,2-alpha-mannosidase n=1 Tax=Cylas formicarius TaxID=197179 RepID=UPI002958A153|nr:endoplasmic reticulum mannosyl-oligosaccharide 1,2-alpha-mannosidase [Cylas formicarius]